MSFKGIDTRNYIKKFMVNDIVVEDNNTKYILFYLSYILRFFYK